MASGRRGWRLGGNDGAKALDAAERVASQGKRLVRDAGEFGASSLGKLEEKWAKAGRLGTRCISTGVGVSIRVPSVSSGPQLVCPTNPEDRCDGCILDMAFVPDFSMEQFGSCFVRAAGIEEE